MNSYLNLDMLHDYHTYGANLKSREIFLHNHYSDDGNPGVEYQMANTFLKNLRCLESKSSDPIIIHMNSIGGSWADGMAIYDGISMSNCHITIISYGQAESMSSIILQSADYRYVTENSYFMCHFGSSGVSGDYLSCQNWTKYEKHICDVMLNIYVNKCVKGKYFKDKYGTKPDKEKIKTYLYRKLKSGDWYLNAQETISYGFADRIIKKYY